MAEGAALRTLLGFKVVDALPRAGDGGPGVTVEELEAATGVQAALLERLLRVLVGAEVVAYAAPTKTYTHAALSAGYVSAAPAGSLFATIFDEVALTAHLPAYFRARGAREPDGELAATHNPTS